MTIAETLQSTALRLAPVLGDLANRKSQYILQHLLKCSPTDFFRRLNQPFHPELESSLETIISRKLTGEPIPYILGTTFFYNKDFILTPDVLIPRPDTETLVQMVLDSESSDKKIFIDTGTGSGAIAGSLTLERPLWKAVGIDISKKALHIAKKNCVQNVMLLWSDMLNSIKPDSVDFIVSNPPYISDAAMIDLDPGVINFEPYGALAGGKDGGNFYRILAQTAATIIKKGGTLYCEIGYDQKEMIEDIFLSEQWQTPIFLKDLAGSYRVFKINVSSSFRI